MNKRALPRPIDVLLDIMSKLRNPEGGCPWDLQQDFKSIAPYTIEEAYEVADAIERGDLNDLKEELGDLLLQVVFHAQMASEQGLFGFDDVATAINEKMVRRHPHVFGDEQGRSAAAVKTKWEDIKAAERAAKGTVSSKLLDEVPANLPGFSQAVKLQEKAARVGFDWPDSSHVIDKLNEEMHELAAELTKGGPPEKIEEELGDLLFVYANLARHLKIDPETALRRANGKFRRRFGYIEETLRSEGRTLDSADLTEMDRLWDAAKALERETD